MSNTVNDMAQVSHNDDCAMLSPGPVQETVYDQLYWSFEEAEGGKRGPFNQNPLSETNLQNTA